MMEPAPDHASTLDRILQERRTTKALSPTPSPVTGNHRKLIREIAAAAAWAPFHKPASRAHRNHSTLTSHVPWRCHLLDTDACRRLRQRLIDQGDDTKIPQLLAVAIGLIQLVWLPDDSSSNHSGVLFEPTLENMEHIAAASAAAQNILLSATSRGLHSYWSSGGPLRSPEMFEYLGIDRRQILLGALFLFPEDLKDAATTPGSLRHKRGDFTRWARWVELQ